MNRNGKKKSKIEWEWEEMEGRIIKQFKKGNISN